MNHPGLLKTYTCMCPPLQLHSQLSWLPAQILISIIDCEAIESYSDDLDGRLTHRTFTRLVHINMFRFVEEEEEVFDSIWASLPQPSPNTANTTTSASDPLWLRSMLLGTNIWVDVEQWSTQRLHAKRNAKVCSLLLFLDDGLTFDNLGRWTVSFIQRSFDIVSFVGFFEPVLQHKKHPHGHFHYWELVSHLVTDGGVNYPLALESFLVRGSGYV